jgi:uncharacterized LabA/DUF88 family protein
MKRVAAYFDGFNLYHALKALDGSHLRWLDLDILSHQLISPKSERLVFVKYFSAFADWMPEQRGRHIQYVRALEAKGVQTIMGQFKVKDRHCNKCRHRWKGHEEKETDVNIALHLLRDGMQKRIDKALLVTRDSDLKPAIEMTLSECPNLEIEVVAPPHFGHSTDLINVSTGKRKITKAQIERSLFPEVVYAPDGGIAAVRPDYYNPKP